MKIISQQIESTDSHQNKQIISVTGILSKAELPPSNQIRAISPPRPEQGHRHHRASDKSNAIVVMNTSECKKKMKNLLSNKAYKKLDKDPTNRTEHQDPDEKKQHSQ